MRIGILTQWFEPEPGGGALPGVLARGLAERGHRVQVVTGFPNYPDGVLPAGYTIRRRVDAESSGIGIRRVALYPNHGRSAIGRVGNYASFGVSAVVSGVGAFRDVDAIWVYNSPITISWPMWAAKLLKRIPSVLHVMDLWPDSILLSGFARQGRSFAAATWALNAWCDRMYSSASSIAYTSPTVGKVLAERGVSPEKLEYVPVWTDERVYHPSTQNIRSQLGIDESAIVLLYAGALGEAQGLSTLIDACSQVQDPRFVCLIAGSGNSESSLREHAGRVASCVKFLGRFPPDAMAALMATSDINYIGLRLDGLSYMTLPSKTQAAMASGRALMVSAPGDVARLAIDSGAGWAVPPGDVGALTSAIRTACDVGRPTLHAMGKRAAKYYQENFSVEHGVTRIEALLRRAADATSRSRANL